MTYEVIERQLNDSKLVLAYRHQIDSLHEDENK